MNCHEPGCNQKCNSYFSLSSDCKTCFVYKNCVCNIASNKQGWFGNANNTLKIPLDIVRYKHSKKIKINSLEEFLINERL